MEMIYAALLLHDLKKEINEENIKKIFEALGVEADTGRIKALVSNLKDVNIDEAIKQTATAHPTAEKEVKKEEKPKEEEKKPEKKVEDSAAGLSALFG